MSSLPRQSLFHSPPMAGHRSLSRRLRAFGLLLGAGWDARSVVMAAVLPALLASAAVFALRRHTSRTTAAEAPALVH